jgi:hypothetical protein
VGEGAAQAGLWQASGAVGAQAGAAAEAGEGAESLGIVIVWRCGDCGEEIELIPIDDRSGGAAIQLTRVMPQALKQHDHRPEHATLVCECGEEKLTGWRIAREAGWSIIRKVNEGQVEADDLLFIWQHRNHGRGSASLPPPGPFGDLDEHERYIQMQRLVQMQGRGVRGPDTTDVIDVVKVVGAKFNLGKTAKMAGPAPVYLSLDLETADGRKITEHFASPFVPAAKAKKKRKKKGQRSRRKERRRKQGPPHGT